jgi:hypothetical protein
MQSTITFPVSLGDEVKDSVTGFTGIVVSLTEWFNACQRATVQPTVDEKGLMRSADTFDVEQLEVIVPNKAPRKPSAQLSIKTGGPMPSVAPHAAPRER